MEEEKTKENTGNFVKWYGEVGIADVPSVGGKNAALGEMYSNLVPLGVRVPDGFALTADAYRHFFKETGLDEKIKEILSDINTKDIHNLQIRGKKVREAILEAVLPQNLQDAVARSYEKLGEKYGKNSDVAVRSSATAEDLPGASFAGQQETYLNVHGIENILIATKKCIASLFTDRAISYRADKGFSHFDAAISVGIQLMVRSDLASSGVAFTIDTETGFDKVILINGIYGLGEFIVQGKVVPDEFIIFKPTLENGSKSPIITKNLGNKNIKLVYGKDGTKEEKVSIGEQQKFCLTEVEVLKLAKWCLQIEKYFSKRHNHYQPMDIEWAKDGKTGELFIVQARPETVASAIDKNVLKEYQLKNTSKIRVKGIAVGLKIGAGKVRVLSNAKNINAFKKGEVLVTEITDPDWEPIMKIASAIVTNSGGRTSHAAIVSRELGIPAVVGCGNATSTIKDGQGVTVSCAEGEVGKIYEGLLKFEVRKTDLTNFVPPKIEIKMIAADPELSFRYCQMPHKGVGLARVEFVISNFIKIHPKALINYNQLTDQQVIKQIDQLTVGYEDKVKYYSDRFAFGIAQLAAAFYPYDVLLRFSDFKSNEYANLIGGKFYEPVEENPMIGWRGASRYYDPNFEDAFALEIAAVKRVREEMGLWNLSVMVPFCRTPEEGQKVVDLISKYGLTNRITKADREKKKNGDLVEGMEI